VKSRVLAQTRARILATTITATIHSLSGRNPSFTTNHYYRRVGLGLPGKRLKKLSLQVPQR
jgi:hypothetical protein